MKLRHFIPLMERIRFLRYGMSSQIGTSRKPSEYGQPKLPEKDQVYFIDDLNVMKFPSFFINSSKYVLYCI